MLRSATLLVAAALLASLAGGMAAGEEASSPARYLVGYSESGRDAALLAIQAAGGEVKRTSPELRVAQVLTQEPGRFESLIWTSPYVEYVERDDPIRLAGSQWNGAQWNGAQWNGAQWNGAQWNGAQWNGAQWNGAKGDGSQWNGAQWNAAQWTKQAYNASGGTKLKYAVESTDPGLVWQWGAWRIHAPEAWLATTGNRTARLCVLDSGVAWDHPDLDANVWTGPAGERGYNAIDPTRSAYDDAGHGTHIAGVAAGHVGNAYGIAGVANVLILNAKVLDSEGAGHEGDLAFGLVWCAAHGADVAVMALSATEPGPTMDRALQYNADRDVLLMASAGNAGPCTDCVAYPASDPRVMAVSAVDGNLALAPFSSRGAQVDLAAPGVDVLGPFPGPSFVFGSGTSQAVAMVAGVASLVRDAHPDMSAEQVRALLRDTAGNLGAPGADDAFGAGLVDAGAALAQR